MNLKKQLLSVHNQVAFIFSILTSAVLYSCTSSSADAPAAGQEVVAVPVLEIKAFSAKTNRDIPATLEGRVNVEIRPQVDGYLEKIYIDEGAYVKKGQPLFKINDLPYQEQLNNAKASLLAAQASMAKAKLEVDRLAPLVKHKVVSDIQLQTAESGYQTAKANVAQAQAQVTSAKINLGYTLITAPANGFMGRLPYKAGSLVGRSEPQPLSILSDVQEMYAYFYMSETEFLQFKEQFPGTTIQEKIKKLPPVQLVLPDNSVFPESGTVQTLEGQVDKTMGAIGFRASFPNPGGLLRSGNTGRIRIPTQYQSAIVIPQEATFEMQDKVLVFAVAGDSNKVSSRPIQVADQSGAYYLIKDGVKPGDRIVFTGHNRLKEGAPIKPQLISMDSLLQAKPL